MDGGTMMLVSLGIGTVVAIGVLALEQPVRRGWSSAKRRFGIGRKCVSCGERGHLTETWMDDIFQVGPTSGKNKFVTARSPVMSCAACDMAWTDWRAELTREAAAREQAPEFFTGPKNA